MSNEYNPPAFPVACTDGVDLYEVPGMTLRDYFAGQAVTGLMARCHINHDVTEVVPDVAYRFADAMLEARQKGGDA